MTGSLDQAGRSPSVAATFSSADRRYEPLDEIQICYTASLPSAAVVRSVERSILWYTEGKGEEDIGVHFFERITERATVAQAAAGGSFEARLPSSPLSYEGVIVKIRWCARVRLFFEEGRDFVSEHIFELGHVPMAMIVPS